MSKQPKQVSAIELQDRKIKAEMKIEKIPSQFNQLCYVNGFQVESAVTVTRYTDSARSFNVDIHLV